MAKQLIFLNILFKRFSIILLIYTTLRIVFYFFNYDLFGGVYFFDFLYILISGLRFDTSILIYINSLFILLHIIPLTIRWSKIYQLAAKIIFYTLNTIPILLSIGDIAFYRYNNKRITSEVLALADSFFNMFFLYLKDFWYLFFFALILFLIIGFLYNKIKIPKRYHLHPVKQILIFLITIPVLIIGARGGFQNQPISPITASMHVDIAITSLITNSPFTFGHSLSKRSLSQKKFFQKDELKKYFSTLHTGFDSQKKPRKRVKKDNIVIIIMEGFSKKFSKKYSKNKGCTPNLDSLMEKGLNFTNAYANGHRSMNGLVSILASIPTLMDDPFMRSKYQNNKFLGLGAILRMKGYRTSFFHGGANDVFNFYSFTKAAGIEHYYGRNEYNDDRDYDGAWGIYDEPFFQFFANKLDSFTEPFLSIFFALSSHHPLKIPEKYKGKFEKGPFPECEAVAYSDFALGKFFKTASQKKWFENTLFIIASDHTSDAAAFESSGGRLRIRTDIFTIPLIFYKKNSNLKGTISFPVQHVDIMPSILDYLAYSENFFSFGQSVFQKGRYRYVFQYLGHIYQIIDQNHVLLFDEKKTIGLYDFKKDPALKKDLKKIKIRKKILLEQKIKAIIQTHNNAMIMNTLAAPDKH